MLISYDKVVSPCLPIRPVYYMYNIVFLLINVFLNVKSVFRFNRKKVLRPTRQVIVSSC